MCRRGLVQCPHSLPLIFSGTAKCGCHTQYVAGTAEANTEHRVRGRGVGGSSLAVEEQAQSTCPGWLDVLYGYGP